MTSDHFGVRLLAAIFGLLAGITCIGATVLAVMVVNAFSLGSWTSITALLVLLVLLVAVNRALVAVLLHLHEGLCPEFAEDDGRLHAAGAGAPAADEAAFQAFTRQAFGKLP